MRWDSTVLNAHTLPVSNINYTYGHRNRHSSAEIYELSSIASTHHCEGLERISLGGVKDSLDFGRQRGNFKYMVCEQLIQQFMRFNFEYFCEFVDHIDGCGIVTPLE